MQYLNSIKLNDKHTNFGDMDLSYLEKDKWDKHYVSAVLLTPTISIGELDSTREKEVVISSHTILQTHTYLSDVVIYF